MHVASPLVSPLQNMEGAPLVWSGRTMLRPHMLPPAPPRQPPRMTQVWDPDEAMLVILCLMSLISFLSEALPRTCVFIRKYDEAQLKDEREQKRPLNCCRHAGAVLCRMAVALVSVAGLEEKKVWPE